MPKILTKFSRSEISAAVANPIHRGVLRIQNPSGQFPGDLFVQFNQIE